MDVDPILSSLVAAVTDGERRKRDTGRAKRQFSVEELEAPAEARDPVSHAEVDASRVAEGEEEEGPQSTAGSAYNPENPYHVSSEFVNNAVCDKQDSGAGKLMNYQEARAEAWSNPWSNINLRS